MARVIINKDGNINEQSLHKAPHFCRVISAIRPRGRTPAIVAQKYYRDLLNPLVVLNVVGSSPTPHPS